MLIDILKKGVVDRSILLRIIDSTDGTPETGVVFNTSGIDLWYRREAAVRTSITEATLSALTTAHADGGFLHVGDGYYRFDIPDAAFATGANYVDFGGTVTGMVVIGGRVRLVDIDHEDTVRGGLTALPNAAAEASGGLPTLSAAQASNGTINSNVHRWLTGTPNALQSGRVDAYLGAAAAGVIAAATFAAAALDAVWSTATRVLTAATNITSTGGTTVPQTGDSFARIGAPAGASIAADLLVIDNFVDDLEGRLTAGRATNLDNLDATISSRASAANLTTLQTSVDDVPTNAELATSQAAADDATLAAIAALNNLSQANIRTAIGLATANLDTQLAALAGYVDTEITQILAAIAALNNLSSAQAQTAAAAALSAYDPPTNAEMEARTLTAALITKLTAHLGGVLTGVVGAGSTTTALVLNAATGINAGVPSATNDQYNGRVIVFLTGTLANQATSISDYVGSTVTMTIVAVTSAPQAGDTFIVV